MWEAMKKLFLGAALLLNAGSAFAEDKPLICWYNDHAALTGADSAPANAVIGSVESTRREGDHAFSYVISAKDSTVCPNELPLGTKKALTVPLVRQDNANCTNDDVAITDASVTGGSATVFRRSNGATEIIVRLVGGTTPNTTYDFSLKCHHKLGSIKTDASGNGHGSFDFIAEDLGPNVAFDLRAEGAAAGNTFQSLRVPRK